MSDYEIAWDLFKEVRKQILEFQRIRAQLLGFKITFVGAAVLVVANVDRIPPLVLLVPALAAIFFDLLITSYSYSIKRSGSYCKEELEPKIKNSFDPPSDVCLWEEYFFANTPEERNLSLISNYGITGLAVALAIIALRFTPIWICIPLIAFGIIDVAVAVYLAIRSRGGKGGSINQ